MSDHYPLAGLKEALDGPVTPRLAFANDLRERLLDQLTAQDQDDSTTEEEAAPMAIAVKRTRFQVLLPTLFRLAAMFLIVAAFAGAHRVGWWGVGPDLQRGSIHAPVGPVTPFEFASPNPEWQTEPLWRSLPDGEPLISGTTRQFIADAIATDGQRVFRLVATSEFTGVIAIDAESGEVLWERPVALSENALIEANANTVFILSDRAAGSALTAIDAPTGEPVWSTETSSEIVALLGWEETLFLWDGRSVLIALAAASGDQTSSRTFPGDSSEELGAEFSLPANVRTIAVVGEALLIGTPDGLIAALPAAAIDTAEANWTQEIDGGVLGFAVTSDAVAVYYRLSEPHRETGQPLEAINVYDIGSGDPLWEVEASSTIEQPFSMTDRFAYYALPEAIATMPAGAVPSYLLFIQEARTGKSVSLVEGIVPVISLPDGRALIGAGSGAEGMTEILALKPDDAFPWGSSFEVLSFGQSTPVSVDEHRIYYVDQDYSLIAYPLSGLGIPEQ
ncbi:MAG: PQQ-binding-like beta-propeller repeat protein [Thermomicrobiales bacterium]|nr:PQQ-binding-like beta-propeller repeat protein [Thermomicrobiales bacterium]